MIDITFKNEKEVQAFREVVKQICEELDKVDDAKDQIKEIVEAAAATFDIPKQLITKVSSLYHKKEVQKFQEQASAVTDLYEQITTPPKTNVTTI